MHESLTFLITYEVTHMMTRPSFSYVCRCIVSGYLMKINKHTPLLAILFASGTLQAAPITIPPGDTPVTIQGNVEIKLPDAPPSSLGTAPAPSTPILNEGPGATTPGVAGLIHTYSTNGAGTQIAVETTNGGILAEANGNLTLSVTESTTSTASYTIETRELKVSDPAGFTDVAGTYGPAGTVYPNGTTLPGSAVNVATVRDTDGKLVSVISDIPGVGPVTAVDISGFPILTPAQITAAVTSGSAPTGFFVAADPVVTPGTGNLSVEGDADVDNDLTVTGETTTNGINNSGEQINGVADGVADDDAATVGQVNAADADIRTDFAAADTSIRTDFAAADTVERNARIAADNTLGLRIDSEVSDRIAGDAALGIRINDEQSARIAADNALGIRINDTNSRVTNETNDRIAADNVLGARIDENTRGIAMVAAMTNTRVEAGKTHGVDFNMAQFQSETGFAFGYANRVNENVQLQTSVASTTDFDESVVRVGVAVQW